MNDRYKPGKAPNNHLSILNQMKEDYFRFRREAEDAKAARRDSKKLEMAEKINGEPDFEDGNYNQIKDDEKAKQAEQAKKRKEQPRPRVIYFRGEAFFLNRRTGTYSNYFGETLPKGAKVTRYPGGRAPWVLGVTLGTEASFGEFISHLPASGSGNEGKTKDKLYGSAQKLVKIIGGVLLGTKNVAGFANLDHNSAISRAVPREGIAPDLTRKIAKNQIFIAIGNALRDGHLSGILRFIKTEDPETLVDIITRLIPTSSNQIIALIGVLEASTLEIVNGRDQVITAVTNRIKQILTNADIIDQNQEIIVATHPSHHIAVSEILKANQLDTQILLKPHLLPQQSSLFALPLTKRVLQSFQNIITQTTGERLHLAKNNYNSHEVNSTRSSKIILLQQRIRSKLRKLM